MAKKAQVITIATVAVIVGIVVGVWRIGGGIWSQGGAHAAQTVQLDTVIEDVKVLKPSVADLKMKVNSLEIKQEVILTGVKNIQATQKIMLERMP